MAPPAWLPPLNSHPTFFTNVEIDELQTHRSFGDLRFCILLTVYVDFYSENDEYRKSVFPGYFITHSRPINVKNPESLKQSLSNLIFNEHLIPFPLHYSFFTERRLCGTQSPELLIPDEDVLFGKMFDFLRLVHEKPENNDMMTVVHLEIQRNVFVPEEEFASWVSWFDEQKRIDPGFESEYSRAIRRPREMSEVYQEAASLMARRPAKIGDGELQIVAVNGGKDDGGAPTMAEESCSICLEGFSDGGRAMRLPCSHMFHENCIVRWLQGNHVCPLCRYELPVDE